MSKHDGMTVKFTDGAEAMVQYDSDGKPERVILKDGDGNAVMVDTKESSDKWTVAANLRGGMLLLDSIKEQSK